jgi:uncharacterized protein (DUF488 family)
MSQDADAVPTIFSIGYSNHSVERFIELLKQHGVTAVGDVRSTPYSRFHPRFNRRELEASLKDAGIEYVFFGNELGGRPEDQSCYINGQLSFKHAARREEFRKGIKCVMEGAFKNRIALMCAEKEPLDCHRTLLVCRALKQQGAVVKHILHDGRLEGHEETEHRLLENAGLEPGPSDSASETMDAAYAKRAGEIAYRQTEKKA